jgi:SAM-dependent methyltransferase
MANETAKCHDKRLRSGDFENFLMGRGIDIGCGGDPVRPPGAQVDPWDQPQGSADLLPGIPDGYYDFVYSSHCLEHLVSVERALTNWCRVLRKYGYLYLVVPDYVLYEKLTFPSIFSGEHKHSFSLHLNRDQVRRGTHWHMEKDVIPFLASLGIRAIRCVLEDDNFDYNVGPGPDQTMWPATLAQICLVGIKGV